MNFSAAPPPPPPPHPFTPHSQDVLPFDSAGNNTSVCIAYLHNCCQNGNRCRFNHKSDKTGIIFCKEFLKIASCKKPTCRFIHATAVEQKAYKEKGIIVQSLQNRFNTVENLNNLLSQYNSNQLWVPQKNMVLPPPPPPATTASPTLSHSNGMHATQSPTIYTNNSSTPVTFPINTSVPPPNYSQLGYQRFNSVSLNQPPPPLPNIQMGYQNWMSTSSQPPPPYELDNGPPPAKKSLDYNIRCQKCCYNHSKLKQSNQEVELLMQQQADINLSYKKLEDLFKELRAGAMLVMKECENPEIRSLLKNHLKATDQAQETIDLQPDHIRNYHQFQSQKYPSQNTNNGSTMQQKLLLLISDKKHKLNQLKCASS